MKPKHPSTLHSLTEEKDFRLTSMRKRLVSLAEMLERSKEFIEVFVDAHNVKDVMVERINKVLKGE